MKKINTGKAENLIGKTFGKLTVLYRTENQGKTTQWACQCECGELVAVSANHLKTGHTTSCGCNKKTKMLKDLSGQKFGKLTVLSYDHSDTKGHTFWLCECDCGNFHTTTRSYLIRGDIISCGCIKSKGEEKIKNILLDNNIPFVQQKSFDNCRFKSNLPAKFDFFVNNQYIIEYDGIQHFKSGTGWNTPEKFQKTLEHDKFKNNWCKENNIPIIRIPYTILNNITIEDLLLESSKYIIKG